MKLNINLPNTRTLNHYKKQGISRHLFLGSFQNCHYRSSTAALFSLRQSQWSFKNKIIWYHKTWIWYQSKIITDSKFSYQINECVNSLTFLKILKAQHRNRNWCEINNYYWEYSITKRKSVLGIHYLLKGAIV